MPADHFDEPASPSRPSSAGAERRWEQFLARSNLTGAQLMIWLGQRLYPSVPLYNMAVAIEIPRRLDSAVFAEAFQRAIDASDALRTKFQEARGVPRQQVVSQLTYELRCLDFSEEQDPRRAFRQWADPRCRHQFPLSGPLFDAVLVKLADDRFIWYLNQHHLITDAWSTSLVYRRVAALYQQLLSTERCETEALPQYCGYVELEREQRQTAVFSRAAEHWRSKPAVEASELTLYGRGVSLPVTDSVRLNVDLGPDRTSQLQQLCREPDMRCLSTNVAMFAVFATTLFAFLKRAAAGRRLSIGTPSHNRPSRELRDTVGLFIELFPLHAEVADDETFASLYERVRLECHEFLRFALPGGSRPEFNRRFGVVLNYIHAHFPAFGDRPIQTEWIHPGHSDPQHQLRLQVHDFDGSGSIQLDFDFNCGVFDETLRERAVADYLGLLDTFLSDRGQEIRTASGARDATPAASAGAGKPPVRHAVPVPAKGTVLELFQHQVALCPDRVAVSDISGCLSFRELDDRSDRLAGSLARRGVGRGSLVGVSLPRSAAAVVSLLAVLKAGAGFVPINRRDPPSRMAHLLADTQAAAVIVDRADSGKVWQGPAPVICIGADGLEPDGPPSFAVVDIQPDDVAYVLHTSGSTGKPKGVVIEHRSLRDYVGWAGEVFLGGEALAFPLFTALSFDLTLTSIFVPLALGGRIVVYQEDELDLAVLRVFEEDSVDVVKLTPSHLSLVHDSGIKPKRIRKLVVGGEDLKAALARAVTDSFANGVEIFNEYGPTECTIACMNHRFERDVDVAGSVPIGRAAAGNSIDIVIGSGRPALGGETGEIYVSGPRLARGYWNRPDLTGERFVEHPSRPGVRCYRTGDLARVNEAGEVVYLGRADQQLKIRGHRVELGEIEAALLELPGIKQCAVDTVQHASQRDVAHCVTCGLPSNVPETEFDEAGVCSSCSEFERYKTEAADYFGDMDELRALFMGHSRAGQYDCLMMLSGGKDSTYVLYQLVELGLRILAVTLDNGYISEGAKENIRRTVADTGVDHRFITTAAMNAIFVESLTRFSNVCNGCFKAMYALCMQLAREHGIKFIVTGLSRGQIFATRLADLYKSGTFDPVAVDAAINQARKVYHRMDDAVSRAVGSELFQDDFVFEEIQFVDFYRYCDVELDELYRYLGEHAPWVRPADTGRSTNCLINEAGIYVHKLDRGFHNYAIPYAWDVRLGHKTRQAAMEELDDEIQPEEVVRMLAEIGFPAARLRWNDTRLVAYYLSDGDYTVSELRARLLASLPDYMVPSYFISLSELPLTTSGKVDRKALPPVGDTRPLLDEQYVPPRSATERLLVEIWQELLGVSRIGVQDNFFELGGDSILNIQIVARAREAGLGLTPKQLFEHPTVAQLAIVAEDAAAMDAAAGNDDQRVRSEDATPGPPLELSPLSEESLKRLSQMIRRVDGRK